MGQNKYKVLIADDEEMIRRLIQALISWDELGLELAASVANGLEAIEFLEKDQVDILITDARMPECDGIELIRWCSEHGLNMKYIVISGYRQFEYAHGAIQYGADNYLLKPINQEELNDNLKTIIQKLDEGRGSVQAEHTQSQIDKNRDRMRRHFITGYIYDGEDFPHREVVSSEYINDEFQLHFTDGIYQAVLFWVDVPESSELDMELILSILLEESGRCFEKVMAESVGCAARSGVIFFVNYRTVEEAKLKSNLEQLYDGLIKKLSIYEGLRLIIGLGSRETSIEKLRTCLTTSVKAVMYQLYLPHVFIIDYDNYSFNEVNPVEIWTHERSMMLENYLRTGNKKGIQKLVFDLKLEIHQDRELSPVSIYVIAGIIADNTSAVLKMVLDGSADKYDLRKEFQHELETKRTIDGIADCIEQMLFRSIDIMENETKQAVLAPIRIIREYIDRHYAENISLNDVADHVHLSRNYVSAIFRKETGVNYLDYLTSRRIDAAAELLRKTDLSISEISEKVGYTDVKYFSKTCKKKLGMNPSEYRKLYS